MYDASIVDLSNAYGSGVVAPAMKLPFTGCPRDGSYIPLWPFDWANIDIADLATGKAFDDFADSKPPPLETLFDFSMVLPFLSLGLNSERSVQNS